MLIEGGLRLGYIDHARGFEIAAFGRNINNDLSLSGSIDFNNLTGFINEPPMWGIEIIARL
jgi:iron complex outermembrane receptor protein